MLDGAFGVCVYIYIYKYNYELEFRLRHACTAGDLRSCPQSLLVVLEAGAVRVQHVRQYKLLGL